MVTNLSHKSWMDGARGKGDQARGWVCSEPQETTSIWGISGYESVVFVTLERIWLEGDRGKMVQERGEMGDGEMGEKPGSQKWSDLVGF